MRLSQLFGKTIKEIPADADSISHQLLVRAGMIQQIGAGVYAYMPLGWRTLRKIENIIRDEMNKAGGQELMMPSIQPLELWEKSGRMPSFGKTLFTITDRKEHKFALGPTHEEIITELARRFVQSYRDLPILPYQIQNKFRDEPRPRGGLLRVREFIMKDLYSFDVDEDALNTSYGKMVEAYKNIYARCGLPAVMVEADSGAIGGKESREFMLLTETGEDGIVYCQGCSYAANLEKAHSIKSGFDAGTPLPLEEISTPGIKTIEEVSAFVRVPPHQTLKAVFYSADGELVFVVIRGDIEVNETKLKNMLKCAELRLAGDAEVAAAGLVAGAASPVGLHGFKIVADESVRSGGNFVAGANKPDTHIKNVNYSRDFKADILGDIATAAAGDECIRCHGSLQFKNGIEVGHVFKLGTFLSQRFSAAYLDANGNPQPIYMGCYGIGLGRLMAAAVEQNHDDKGIIWPLAIAPYSLHLCVLKPDDAGVMQRAETVYEELCYSGLEVLFDDRNESAGIKFNDADLIGIPLRLTISPRTLQSDSIEIKWRAEKEARLLPLAELVEHLKTILKT
ncbi:MAG TPA: proline--tRNA ligase [Dehalococcoidia bacterium]|nr:proline--tRNA ligase [Dehalococcoidia bacterium]